MTTAAAKIFWDPGAIYHPPYGGTSVMNRGNRREEIFKDDPDREQFLAAQGGGLP
jgi:hypothetical protein